VVGPGRPAALGHLVHPRTAVGIITEHIQKVSPSTLPFPETLKIQNILCFSF